jgi:hypothetical protein
MRQKKSGKGVRLSRFSVVVVCFFSLVEIDGARSK